MSNIEIATDNRGFNQEHIKLQKNVDELNLAVKLCKEITEGKVNAFNFDTVNQWLLSKADFPNLTAIADLLGCKTKYEKLIELNAKKQALESEFITFDKGVYNITEKSLQALKSSFTTYLSDAKVNDYNQLQKVVKIMNSLDKQTRLALKRTADLEYNINLFRLNHNV